MTTLKRYDRIRCITCDGHGIADRGYHNPEECPDCNGSGVNVRYANGSVAKFYGGPLISGPTTVRQAAL